MAAMKRESTGMRATSVNVDDGLPILRKTSESARFPYRKPIDVISAPYNIISKGRFRGVFTPKMRMLAAG